MDWNKLITSSADPKKISLTVRGFLIAVAPIAMLLLGVNDIQFNEAVDAVVNVVFLGTSLWSAVWVLYGTIRKVKLGRWSAK